MNAAHVAFAPAGYTMDDPMFFADNFATQFVGGKFFFFQDFVPPVFKGGKALVDDP